MRPVLIDVEVSRACGFRVVDDRLNGFFQPCGRRSLYLLRLSLQSAHCDVSLVE